PDRSSRADALRFAVGRCRRPRARSLERLRFHALAATASPARRSRRQSQEASLSAGRRLPPDPPFRKQRLVCSAPPHYRRGAARTLGDRPQILPWFAVPHCAQRVAGVAPAAAEAVPPVASGLLGTIAFSKMSSCRAPPQQRQRPRTSGAKWRVAAAARSAG